MRIRQNSPHTKWAVRQHFTRLYHSQEISSINTNKNHINSDPGWRSQVVIALASYGIRSNKDGLYIRPGGYCISDVTDYRLLNRLRHFWSTCILPYRHCEKVDKGRWFIWNVGTSVQIRGRHSKKPMNFVATVSNTYPLACFICQRSYQYSSSYTECQIEAAIYQASRCSAALALKCSSDSSLYWSRWHRLELRQGISANPGPKQLSSTTWCLHYLKSMCYIALKFIKPI